MRSGSALFAGSGCGIRNVMELKCSWQVSLTTNLFLNIKEPLCFRALYQPSTIISPRAKALGLIRGSRIDKSGDNQGPVVQSIVSLTSSLRGQLVECFATL